VEIPLLSDIPLVGKAFFGQSWPAYLIYPLIPFTWWLLYRTRWGLEVGLRARTRSRPTCPAST
jgi:general nucleoside transport system permease protein